MLSRLLFLHLLLLLLFSSQDLPLVFTKSHTFSVSETSSRKGAEVNIYNMDKRWMKIGGEGGQGGYHLAVGNCHLDPMNKSNQLQQLRETYTVPNSSFLLSSHLFLLFLSFLVQFLADSLLEAKETVGLDLRRTALVLCGDFNIDSMFEPQYVQTKITEAIFRNGARDLHSEFQKRKNLPDLPTYNSRENSLVIWDQTDRLDYCFAFDFIQYAVTNPLTANGVNGLQRENETDAKKNESDGRVELLRLKITNLEVVKQPRGQEWSDHWVSQPPPLYPRPLFRFPTDSFPLLFLSFSSDLLLCRPRCSQLSPPLPADH